MMLLEMAHLAMGSGMGLVGSSSRGRYESLNRKRGRPPVSVFKAKRLPAESLSADRALI